MTISSYLAHENLGLVANNAPQSGLSVLLVSEI